MASRLEQARAILAQMRMQELEIVQAEITAMLYCALLELPRELRDRIYYFAAFFHLRDIGPCKTPGLLLANKQTREEFGDVIYSPKLLTAKHRQNTAYIAFSFLRSPIFNKALLEHRFLTTRFLTNRFSCTKVNAELLVNALKRQQGSGHSGGERFGVLELMGAEGGCCAVIQYPLAVPESMPADKQAIQWLR